MDTPISRFAERSSALYFTPMDVINAAKAAESKFGKGSPEAVGEIADKSCEAMWLRRV